MRKKRDPDQKWWQVKGAPDWLYHCLVGFVLFLVVYLASEALLGNKYIPIIVAHLFVFFVGVGKETVDSINYEEFSWEDIKYNIIGAFIAMVICLIY